MIWDRELEQLFLRRREGRIEAAMVFEDPSGARHRETLPLPYADPLEATSALARILARRGDVAGAPRLRVREETSGGLNDRPDLRDAFRRSFEAEAEVQD